MTNDDGVSSPGLRALAAAAVAGGLEVTVVAPAWDASGSSASMTVVARDGRVLIDNLISEDGTAVLGVQGPPAFIVRAAMYGAFGPPPDLVLSGVNRGLNTGRAILHSGTVGAALTAATFGRRGLAVSAEVESEDGWEPDSPVIASALDWIVQSPEGTVLNVNIPAVGRRGWLGVKRTALAENGTVQGSVTELSGDYVPVTFGDEQGSRRPGTDTAALAEGYVSVTAVRGVQEDLGFDLDQILERERNPVRP